ncbi:hypothetical protein, partial [Agrococcus sp. HG114]|uniref:hypothetical protein n=1 Tax=Agrococcus sp. HG114 TaxID=2969757 RepID=UPI00215B1E87
PPRPPLPKAHAHAARLAGGVGGGIAWLGLGIAQAAIILLALPMVFSAAVFGIGFAISGGGPSATSGAWPQLLDWLGSPGAVLLMLLVPLGVVVWLLGLWLSARMLRRAGLARPAGVTWAGFGVALGANLLLGSLGGVTFGPALGMPFGGPSVDIDPSDTDWGRDWGANGVDLDPQLLERIADPGQLVALASPWVALGTLASLVVPIALSVLSWWWMAHALRAKVEPEVVAEA